MAAAQGCPVVSLGVPAFFFIAAMAQCAVVVLVRGQSQEGFISIDCGIAAGTSYVEADNGITYESDMDYIDTGVNHMILSPSDWPKRYHTLRSFPEGIRNCYKLRPVSSDKKYLVRAGFHYGNYDNKNSTPVFDLYIGVNLWRTLGKDPFIEEIITVVPTDYDSLFVCLVNTGQGTPFISVLELRPIPDSMYLLANKSQSLVLTENRRYYGAIPILRYPRDPYDRIWFNSGVSGVYSLNTTENVKIGTLMDEFQVPSSVLSTAIRTYNTSYHLPLSIKVVNARAGDTIYVLMHFAELELLMSNETRQMNIYQAGEGDGSGRLLFANYTPPYLEADARVANATLQGGEDATYNLSIYASASSTRPPMINALESYIYVSADGRLGHPPWRRNLTSSGLSGGIPTSLANLTALTILDMSNNSLTGAIPDFLAELPSLKLLILTDNKLTGTIPSRLCEKNQSAALSVSIEGNPGTRCSQTTRKRKIFIFVPIIASVSILLVLLVTSIIVWRIRRKPSASDGLPRMQQKEELKLNNMAKATHSIFTFTEIKEITNNFEKPIGRGGFGTVYLGYVNDGTQVAVKVLSPLSSQGPKEFQAEALLLTRVHHKNLVSLLGYCNDEHNLALVYEYMDQGTLRDHLSGNNDSLYVLGWEQRVKIALQAAQGLDYLHNGCRPLIIHRDVKSNNILLKHDFIAKLADFGLSRAFNDETQTQISTALAGTLGYLDPEYCQSHRLNEKSDVYSFGIVLLEIITGRPVFSSCPERIHIIQWVESKLENGGTSNIVDTKLCGDYDINSAREMLEIAMACTSASSMERLTMSRVVIKLKECSEMDVTGGMDDSGVPSGELPFIRDSYISSLEMKNG